MLLLPPILLLLAKLVLPQLAQYVGNIFTAILLLIFGSLIGLLAADISNTCYSLSRGERVYMGPRCRGPERWHFAKIAPYF